MSQSNLRASRASKGSLQQSLNNQSPQNFGGSGNEGFNNEAPMSQGNANASLRQSKNSQQYQQQSPPRGGANSGFGQNPSMAEMNMARQEQEDNSEMATVKRKLAQLEAKPQPRDKNAMVAWLMQRVQVAEGALQSMEEIVGHERGSRKAMGQDLLEKNDRLRGMIQDEKSNLKDKVTTEMRSTLDHAQRDYQQLQQLNEQAEMDLVDRRERLIQSRKDLAELKNHAKTADVEHQNSVQDVENIKKDIQSIQTEKMRLNEENIEREKAVDKAAQEDQSAREAFYKVDECRILLNQLLGPSGPLSQNVRHTFLQGAPASFAGPITTVALPTNPKNNYNQNFAPSGKKSGSLKQAAILPEMQASNAEEDFWYQQS